MSTPATRPPMAPSNEATTEQLIVARNEGDTYLRALEAMAAEESAVTRRAGDFLVAFVTENAEGMYSLVGTDLAWREASEEANVHMEVGVADAGDGRFVPGLAVRVDVERDGQQTLSAGLPFLWHPFLYHYGANGRVPDPGPYDVTIHIEPADFMRHDPVNGRRFAEPVQVRFEKIRFSTGRKPSPDAKPRGASAPTAGLPAG